MSQSSSTSPSQTQEAPDREAARATMQRYWNHEQFRPGQGDAIEAVLDRQDVLAILPTGGGKSICYQVPAVLLDGLTVVVSPLIALMHDQVDGLADRGLSAACIDSTLSRYEIDQRWTNAEHGKYDLLYVAPERFDTDMFQARAGRLDVDLLAVDEAHCVSEWGHHFRPAYRRIPEAREHLGGPPTLAVTATATPAVRRDVVNLLELRDPEQIVRGFDRPNIVWSIFRTENKRAKVRDVLDGVAGSGIIYAATRRGVEQWNEWLRDEGLASSAYHAGRSAEEREKAQRQWVAGDVRVIVATNAFGMGIDKPDVRFVIHVDVPSSLEAYYQEAGRAGRDGDRAHAVLLFQEQDAETQQALIETSHPSATDLQEVYDAVCSVGQVPIGSQPDEPISVDVSTVGELTDLSPSGVRTAVELLDRAGAWEIVPHRRHYGLIRFEQPADAIRSYARSQENRALADFVMTLLRAVHADAFSGWWDIDLRLLERRTELDRERLFRGLRFLKKRELIDWRPPRQALQVKLAEPRSSRYPIDGRTVKRARERAETKLKYMLRYARSATCRRRFLLSYFGEAAADACGACDVCLGRHRSVTVTPSDEEALRAILHHIDEGRPREEWKLDASIAPPHQVDALVNWLMQGEYITLEDPLKQTFSLTSKARNQLD